MVDEQTLENSRTGICDNSEEILPMDENPVIETLEVENPSPKFDNSGEILCGSIDSTLESDKVIGMEENSCKENMDFGNSGDVIVAQMTGTLDFGGIVKDVEFETSVGLDCCHSSENLSGCSMTVEDDSQIAKTVKKILETVHLENPVSDCCETAGNLDRCSKIADVHVANSVDDVPATMQLESVGLDCCETGGIIGRLSEIDDAQVAKSDVEIPDTMQLENPGSDCSETGVNIVGLLSINDAQVAKSVEEIPETLQLENPVSDICETGGVLGESLAIDDDQIAKTVEETAQFVQTVNGFIKDSAAEVENVQSGKTVKECTAYRFDETPGVAVGSEDDDAGDPDSDMMFVNECQNPIMFGHDYSGCRNADMGCLSDKNGFKSGGVVGPLNHCGCPQCSDRNQHLKDYDCAHGCDYEDDCRMMELVPNHPYYNDLQMSPFPRDGNRFDRRRRGLSMSERDYHYKMSNYRMHCLKYEGRFMRPDCMDGEAENSMYDREHHFRMLKDPTYRELYRHRGRFMRPDCMDGDFMDEGEHRFRMRRDFSYRLWYEHTGRHLRPYSIDGEAEGSYIFGQRSMNRGHNYIKREFDRDPDHCYNWSEPECYPVGAGLKNLGNTCFLNAIIQCFTHTVPLVEGLQSLKHDASSHGKDEFCVLCAVRHQIECSLALSGRIFSPSNLVDNLNHISSDFRRNQQEDAHDFLMSLLDKLDSNWSKHEGNTAELSSPPTSLVNQVFGGRLVSQLMCCKCGHNSDSYEPLIDLSMEIEDVDDLESAFKSFTKVETLQDITCDNCKENVIKEKQLLLDQAPPVAALHLKRFKSDGIRVEKIDRMVKYPLELDLHPYTKSVGDDNEALKYELYGFVVHVGFSSISGHYFCYIRTSPDAWYRFDDSKVTKVSESTALAQEAYILFYVRKGTPWFSDLLDKWKANLDDKQSSSPKSVLNTTNLPSTSCHDSDNIDSTAVTFAEPLSCVKPDEFDKESSISANTGCFSSSREQIPEAMHDEVSVNNGDHLNDDTQKAKLETSSMSNVENCFIGEPKFDDDLDINPCILAEHRSPNMHSDYPNDDTQMAKLETSSMSNVENSYIGDYGEPKFDDDLDINSCVSAEHIIPNMHFDNPNDETGTAKFETCSMSDIANSSLAGPKFHADVNINPCMSNKPGTSDMPSDREEPDAEQVTCQIPLDHLKIHVKAPLTGKGRLGKAKQDMARKEAARYVKSAMPSARRHILMGYLNGNRIGSSISRKRRKYAGYNHKLSPKKRLSMSKTPHAPSGSSCLSCSLLHSRVTTN